MRNSKVAYKLHMYGDDRIEDETLYFSRMEPAVSTVEGRCSDDTDVWKFKEDGITLVDYNNGCAVINKISKVLSDQVDQEIHNEPVW